MKIRNISKTVVGIGNSKVLLPDDEIILTKEKASVPAIGALAKAGILSIDDSDERIPASMPQPDPAPVPEDPQAPENAPEAPENDDKDNTGAETTASPEKAHSASRGATKTTKRAKNTESAPSA